MLSHPGEPDPDKLLLVEGNDDLRFFNAMCRHFGINGIAISSYNGKSNLLTDLPARAINPDFHLLSGVGIVRDADNNSGSAFASVVSTLRKAELPIPAAPLAPAERDGLRVSVLILPPDGGRGELEDVCLSSIAGSPDMQCVDRYFDCLGNTTPMIAPNRVAKARLHAYLAAGPARAAGRAANARRRPGLRLGEAADAGVWNWDSPAFRPIKDFLLNL